MEVGWCKVSFHGTFRINNQSEKRDNNPNLLKRIPGSCSCDCPLFQTFDAHFYVTIHDWLDGSYPITVLESLVYADKPQTLDHLEDNIRRVIADIRPQMLEKVIENWTSRLDYIRASRGNPMPEIIFKM
ncbi:hypothetical protein TNCV_1010381 [Trichonephila clavipes]|nr:hypothetical protein TNCV_1010381 [Trichonephila clavipes]